MKSRTYTKIVLAVGVPVWIIVTWFVFTTPPFVGDMTRIGGYSEVLFMPQDSQEQFLDPGYDKAVGLQEYTNAYDVVVIGDSFSQEENHGWQGFLAEKTGWSILTFHRDNVDVSQLVRSDVFVEHPPKILIYEIVEHGVHGFSFKDNGEPFLKSMEQENFVELPICPATVGRETPPPPARFSLDIQHGMHRFKRWLKRVTGSSSKVYRSKLSRSDLFSNKASDEILIYHGDFWKNEVSTQQWSSVNGKLNDLQQFVQSNGKTIFVLMIATDKATIYRPYIIDSPMPILSAVDLLETNRELNLISLEYHLSTAVNTGSVKDIYLANDTHWGSVGHRLAADSVFNYLKTNSKIQIIEETK